VHIKIKKRIIQIHVEYLSLYYFEGDGIMVTNLFVSVIVFLIVVEIITVLFKLTGLTDEKARFQVISLLTGTGFTTKEAELIMQHPTRRKLAQFLMILGYLGFFVGTSLLVSILQNPVTTQIVGTTVIFIVVIFVVVRNPLVTRNFDHIIERIVLKYGYTRAKSKHKMYRMITRAKGYGIFSIIIDEDSHLEGVTIFNSNLKPNNMIILNIDKGDEFIGFVKRDYTLEKGDNILIYGKVDQVIKTFHLNKKTAKEAEIMDFKGNKID
jgi:hypothetical protein